MPAGPRSAEHGDHGAMAGCILFLVVGGAALILLLLRLREGQGTTGLGRFAGIAVTDMRFGAAHPAGGHVSPCA